MGAPKEKNGGRRLNTSRPNGGIQRQYERLRTLRRIEDILIIARREGFVVVEGLRVEATPTGKHRRYFTYRLVEDQGEVLRGGGRAIRRALLEFLEGRSGPPEGNA